MENYLPEQQYHPQVTARTSTRSKAFILAAEKGCFLPRDMTLGQTQACVSLYTQDEPCSPSHRRNLMLFHPGAFRDWPGLQPPSLPIFQPWCQVQAPATAASVPSSSPMLLPGAPTPSPNSWRIRLPEVFFSFLYSRGFRSHTEIEVT